MDIPLELLKDDSAQALLLIIVLAAIGWIIKRIEGIREIVLNTRENHLHDVDEKLVAIRTEIAEVRKESKEDIGRLNDRLSSIDEFLRSK